MHNLRGYAVRQDGVIKVHLSGFLPDSCHRACVKDQYPGGNIVYTRDPGAAQIFIEETIRPNSFFCRMVLVPWYADLAIVDDYHEKVDIFVNGERATSILVKDLVAPLENFIVVSLTGGEGNVGCSILPEDVPYLAIYTQVFGPASKSECEAFVRDNCVGV